MTLMVDFDDPLRVDGVELPRAWVAGPSRTTDRVELGPKQTSLDVKLTPFGAYRVFGVPPRELAEAVVPLDRLTGDAGVELVERLREASDWESRFKLMDRFLCEHGAEGPSPTPAVAHAWSRLCASAGQVPIGALARELRMSRRHLTAVFHEQVGLPPKSFARLLRFAAVRRHMNRRPTSWAEAAQACGYFDQSHLNRDFRDFAGTTPGDFLSSKTDW